MVVDIPDVVTYTNFGDHRLRGFWVAGGQISPSPIDFHRRPYNTLALPCERVIGHGQFLTPTEVYTGDVPDRCAEIRTALLQRSYRHPSIIQRLLN